MTCPNCGAEIAPRFTICPHCSTRLISQQPPGAGSAEPPTQPAFTSGVPAGPAPVNITQPTAPAQHEAPEAPLVQPQPAGTAHTPPVYAASPPQQEPPPAQPVVEAAPPPIVVPIAADVPPQAPTAELSTAELTAAASKQVEKNSSKRLVARGDFQAGWLFLISGVLLLALYLYRFIFDYASVTATYPLSMLFAQATATSFIIVSGLFAELLGIFAGIALVIAGIFSLGGPGGRSLASIAIVAQALLLVNTVTRWVYYFIEYFNKHNYNTVFWMLVFLVFEIILMILVRQGMLLKKRARAEERKQARRAVMAQAAVAKAASDLMEDMAEKNV